MNIVNLYHYISQGLFFKNQTTQKAFDIIIGEKAIPNAPSNFISLDTQNLEFGISWVIASFAQNHKNILIILDNLNLFYLIPLFKKLPKDTNITILNLGAWISSAINKDYLDNDDISLALNYPLSIYDPIDLIHFFKVLAYKHTKIIRIPNKDLPTNISSHLEVKSWQKQSILTPTQTKLKGSWGNIFTHWYLFAQLIQIHQYLKQAQQKDFDGFLINNWQFANLDKIKINQQKPTIFILDQAPSQLLQSYIQFKLQINDIKFIYPQKITTIQEEGLWLQAGLEAKALMKQIQKIL